MLMFQWQLIPFQLQCCVIDLIVLHMNNEQVNGMHLATLTQLTQYLAIKLHIIAQFHNFGSMTECTDCVGYNQLFIQVANTMKSVETQYRLIHS